MEKEIIMSVAIWILFLGGLFGFAMGMLAYFAAKTPLEYGTMGIGGGAYLFGSGVLAYLKYRH
ncbi:hypothetical protein HYW75_02670 [Candidatus Pacearchaeota archaeon]|nr:hypothetical protein [Candidatus Pacearchaeota archaeon]